VTELRLVAKETTRLPAKFIVPAGNNIKDSFKAYCEPLVGELPVAERLKGW
jgi:hypothetical protein